MTHELKIYPEYADKVYDGTKTFEIRQDDRGFSAGDKIVFKVYEPMIGFIDDHPLHNTEYEITYVFRGTGLYGLECGYAVLAIKPASKELKR
jgi:hypothetical protein